jgi:hypothetical protein
MTLIFRGAIAAAEDRNHDDRSGLSPVELEYLKYMVFRGEEQLPETYVGAASQIPHGKHQNIATPAEVNAGRWIVQCPWCLSASIASRSDPRFFCVECRNAGAQGKWITVTWPSTVDDIEALLVMRPDPRTRNWKPIETTGDLMHENERHGIL